MINIIICEDYEEVSDKAFEIMHEVVTSKPDCVLGLATGSSPVGLYKRMIKDHEENGTSYKDVVTFNLDEYIGIPEEHPESYHSFMQTNLFYGLDVKPENIHVPSAQGDPEANAVAYEELLAPYQIDLQVLGIGADGHIGFNEPGTPLDILTHITDLEEQTIRDNARFFDGDMSKVPTKAITMGTGSIMKAKKIILLANGTNKADAIYGMIKGPVSADCPSSALQEHPDCYVIIDKLAAAKL